MDKLTFAVLVDGENAPHSEYEMVLKKISEVGEIAIKWIYADWTFRQNAKWSKLLQETASSPKQQFNYGKDACDHALVMDSIELICKQTKINAVCIVSSDGGFYSLAQRIREHGLYVMVIGKENTPERLRKACNQFVFSNDLRVQTETSSEKNIDKLLVESYERTRKINNLVYLGDFGSMLKSIDKNFSYKNFGVSSLKDFIKSYPHLFKITLEKADQCFIEMKPCSETTVGTVHSGVVRLINSVKGFGFIQSEVCDFYFKLSAVDKTCSIIVGSPVKFEALDDSSTARRQSSKCPAAHKVTLG